MGFWNRLFGAGASNASSELAPDALRAQLFDAALAGRQPLLALVKAHTEAIRTAFPGWKTVPTEFRADPSRLKWYGQGLIAVAQCFAEQLADDSLMQQLLGPPAQNPIKRWQASLERTDQLMAKLRYAEAEAELTEQLEQVEKLSSSDALSMQAMTLGRQGECRFNMGRAEQALADFQRAEQLSVRAGDVEGERSNLRNQLEALRWAGRHAEAAPVAVRLASLLRNAGRADDADRLQARASWFHRGEPLLRALLEVDGRVHELDALPAKLKASKVRVLFERNRLTLRPCEALTNEGRRLGSAGNLTGAREHFLRAAEADQFDPGAHYEAAFTSLLLGEPGAAVDSYTRAEALAPGWFHVRADLWLAHEVLAGRVDAGVAGAVLTVDAITDRLERERIAQALTTKVPTLPHAWLALSEAATSSSTAITAAQRGLECAVEPDIRSRLLLKIATAGDTIDHRLLAQLLTLEPGNLVSQAMARWLLHGT